jgi:hypothetical protein
MSPVAVQRVLIIMAAGNNRGTWANALLKKCTANDYRAAKLMVSKRTFCASLSSASKFASAT